MDSNRLFYFIDIMEEIWKDVVGYEGFYLVSNLGNVRRVESVTNRKHGRNSKGYSQVCLSVHGKQKNFLIHRLVASAFVWKPQDKTEVNHINGVKNDNRAENLEWVTSRENHLHAVKMGLSDFSHMTGVNSICGKLTPEDVINIRKLRAVDKLKLRTIAEKYGVCKRSVQDIISFRNWKYIKPVEYNLGEPT